jgi:hypothetical protein
MIVFGDALLSSWATTAWVRHMLVVLKAAKPERIVVHDSSARSECGSAAIKSSTSLS